MGRLLRRQPRGRANGLTMPRKSIFYQSYGAWAQIFETSPPVPNADADDDSLLSQGFAGDGTACLMWTSFNKGPSLFTKTWKFGTSHIIKNQCCLPCGREIKVNFTQKQLEEYFSGGFGWGLYFALLSAWLGRRKSSLICIREISPSTHPSASEMISL